MIDQDGVAGLDVDDLDGRRREQVVRVRDRRDTGRAVVRHGERRGQLRQVAERVGDVVDRAERLGAHAARDEPVRSGSAPARRAAATHRGRRAGPSRRGRRCSDRAAAMTRRSRPCAAPAAPTARSGPPGCRRAPARARLACRRRPNRGCGRSCSTTPESPGRSPPSSSTSNTETPLRSPVSGRCRTSSGAPGRSSDRRRTHARPSLGGRRHRPTRAS